MKILTTNIFIVDDDKVMVTATRQFLERRFGRSVKITTFNDGESCLKKVDETLHLVILDYYMKNKNGLEILKSIKTINPKTEVIMLTGNEDMVIAIESLRAGAKNYVAKGTGSQGKVTQMVDYLIAGRNRILTKKIYKSKYISIFLITLTIIGLLVVCVMRSK